MGRLTERLGERDARGARGHAGCGEAPARAGGRRRAALLLLDERGQGTTEYAILVGVLVVIAIIAIVAFRDRVTQLWQAISDGINSL